MEGLYKLKREFNKGFKYQSLPINLVSKIELKDEDFNICCDEEIKNIKSYNEKLLNKVISLEEKLNESIENDKLKTEFFTNISHEIRTPLNVILGVIQLYEQAFSADFNLPNNERSKKYLKVMKQNCYRLLRLVNNLIDLTKIDSGYFSLNKRNCNIVSIIEDITTSVVEYAESKGITLIFDTDIEEKIMACDPDKIERIIMNLLSNAIKFTPFGGCINVDLIDKGEKIIVKVKDTGIGIPKEKQKSVFNRFVQVDKTNCSYGQGSGIGLALVKSIVDMHHGTVDVISVENQGTEFIMELPYEELPQGYMVGVDNVNIQSKIEKINIEFSDIYS